MSRLHARNVSAILRTRDDAIDLVAPAPGLFRSSLHAGDVVRGGMIVGQLEVLGQLVDVVAPEGANGAIVAVPELARNPVDHGGVLFALDPRVASGTAERAAAASTIATMGLVFRAPTSGRFYGRPSPDKAAFVSAGSELAVGATICLLEVMKTFHRVTYGGAGLPDRARVTTVLVTDGADVNAGDALLALEAL